MGRTVALVTGANKGIGYQIAARLAADGATVLVGARDTIAGQAAVARLVEAGGDAVHVSLDVTDAGSVAAAAKWVEQEYGRLDVLVNNAGVLLERGEKPSETTAEKLRRTYETNVIGVVVVTNAMLPLLRQAPAARIVNVSSELGSLSLTSDPTNAYSQFPLLAYNSSKSALNAITVSYANELRGTSIKVNAADPGILRDRPQCPQWTTDSGTGRERGRGAGHVGRGWADRRPVQRGRACALVVSA